MSDGEVTTCQESSVPSRKNNVCSADKRGEKICWVQINIKNKNLVWLQHGRILGSSGHF